MFPSGGRQQACNRMRRRARERGMDLDMHWRQRQQRAVAVKGLILHVPQHQHLAGATAALARAE